MSNAISSSTSGILRGRTISPALQDSLLQTVATLGQLVVQLAREHHSSGALPATAVEAPGHNHAEPWVEAPPTSPLWDELSVVELRSLLRSYPIDRTSLPAPIELLRRRELVEALQQIESLR